VAPGALRERQRGATGPAGDVESAAVRAEAEQAGDLGLLGGASPAGLPEVFAVHLAPQRSHKVTAEAAVVGTVEVEAVGGGIVVLLGHDEVLRGAGGTSAEHEARKRSLRQYRQPLVRTILRGARWTRIGCIDLTPVFRPSPSSAALLGRGRKG
jgi:hypothetical protein